MIGLLCFALAVVASPFKSKLRLEAENAVLRHQLIVLRRRLHGRVRLTNNDRWFFIQLYRWFPSILQVLTIIQPETLVRWHRAGRIDGNQRYSWIKNQRSLLVSRTRPCSLRLKTINCCRSTVFSASSRNFDLNGEARMARTKQSSPIIPPA